MRVEIRHFFVPKEGNSSEEYEDAFACDPRLLRFAMADGATEASYSREWARILVDFFVSPAPKHPDPVWWRESVAPGGALGYLSNLLWRAQQKEEEPKRGPLERWLASLQEEWRATLDCDNVPWFVEQKLKAGAHAAFLGVTLEAETRGRPARLRRGGQEQTHWVALAFGDTCLFQVRSRSLLTTFPVQRARDFSNRPSLLCSNPEKVTQADLDLNLRGEQGGWQEGDLLILATDALARWFLNESESGGQPWSTLTQMSSQADFESLIRQLRVTDRIVNDDTTVALIAGT